MKCAFCNGELKEETVEHKEFGISLGKFQAQVCKKCGEPFYDSGIVDTIQEKAKKLGLFGLVSHVRAAKVGNSIVIRIPKKTADFVNLKPGTEVIIHPEANKIIAEIA
jgi:predicted nucleic-acid-binding Zn-ribbon protein